MNKIDYFAVSFITGDETHDSNRYIIFREYYDERLIDVLSTILNDEQIEILSANGIMICSFSCPIQFVFVIDYEEKPHLIEVCFQNGMYHILSTELKKGESGNYQEVEGTKISLFNGVVKLKHPIVYYSANDVMRFVCSKIDLSVFEVTNDECFADCKI